MTHKSVDQVLYKYIAYRHWRRPKKEHEKHKPREERNDTSFFFQQRKGKGNEKNAGAREKKIEG